MEAPVNVKPRRGSPPIPPNYVSLRQLQELRLKEEQEKRQREEEEAAAAAAAMAKREAARQAEIVAMAAAAAKREAARKPETKAAAVVAVAPVRAKERRAGGLGAQWVAVAHKLAVPPPRRREPVPEADPVGVGRGSKGPADAPRGGGKPEGKAKEKVSAAASAQTRTTADEPGGPGKTAEDSSHGGKLEDKGERKGKGKAKEEKASGDTAAEPRSIAGSGESAGAPYRRRKNSKGKKGAGGRSAESASAKTAGASPLQGVKPDNDGKPRSPEPKRADASPTSDSSRGKKPDATPAPPTSATAGVVGELRVIAEAKPESRVEVRSRSPAVDVQVAAEQKPRFVSRRPWPRPAGDRCNGTGEQQHGRVWVPKSAGGCSEH